MANRLTTWTGWSEFWPGSTNTPRSDAEAIESLSQRERVPRRGGRGLENTIGVSDPLPAPQKTRRRPLPKGEGAFDKYFPNYRNGESLMFPWMFRSLPLVIILLLTSCATS